mmetsp:Transcript_13193/g.29338  ORF Transcript_13193/g.29338 Transcript_13193/m.29338 type:complete len:116 (+) Transcript_13193:291-638(+)
MQVFVGRQTERSSNWMQAPNGDVGGGGNREPALRGCRNSGADDLLAFAAFSASFANMKSAIESRLKPKDSNNLVKPSRWARSPPSPNASWFVVLRGSAAILVAAVASFGFSAKIS